MDTTKTQVRAACYLRISSDPNDKREGVDRQRADTTALCEVKNWTPVDFYVDNDRSASNGKQRQQWDRLLADIKAGKIDAIAAWDQDRNWRMMSELEDLRKYFRSIGREPALATTGQGDVDLYSPTGVLTAQIKTAVSEHEVAMMKVRMRRAAVQKAEQGTPKWRTAFGYLPDTRSKADDDGTRQLDPVTAPLVKAAYRAILTGASLSDICRMFNNANAFGLKGQPWTAPTVSLFLRSPRNAGLRAHNKQIVGKGTWPALVNETTWRTAQAKMNAPSRKPGKKTVQRHLLTRILQCGKPGCGGYLSGYKTSKDVNAYSCKSCRGVAVRAADVEDLLYKLVGGRLAKPDAIDLLKSKIHDEDEAEAVRTTLATLYTRLDNLAVEHAEGLMTARQVKVSSDVINHNIEKLEHRQQDQDRMMVLDGIPLGKPEALQAVRRLSPNRFRAVVDVLAIVTVRPVGKGSHIFDPERVVVDWK
jgi:DNA invertase Pin-like site-specific DNA recombinase